jgi:hypothetical protein
MGNVWAPFMNEILMPLGGSALSNDEIACISASYVVFHRTAPLWGKLSDDEQANLLDMCRQFVGKILTRIQPVVLIVLGGPSARGPLRTTLQALGWINDPPQLGWVSLNRDHPPLGRRARVAHETWTRQLKRMVILYLPHPTGRAHINFDPYYTGIVNFCRADIWPTAGHQLGQDILDGIHNLQNRLADWGPCPCCAAVAAGSAPCGPNCGHIDVVAASPP